MKLSIIIPAFNEEKSIKPLFVKLLNIPLPDFVRTFEIIVVNDGSTDGTVETAEKISSRYNHVRLIHHSANKGKGAAIQSGISKCNGDIVAIQDADEELSPGDLPALIIPLQGEDTFFVSGTRYSGRPKDLLTAKGMANFVFSWLASILTQKKITDLTCGYKVFKKSWVKQMQLKETGFGIETELYLKAIKTNKSGVVEIPVSYHSRNKKGGKKLRNRDALVVLEAIFKCGIRKNA